MKKWLSVVLAIMLLISCAAPAMASVYDWCYSLPDDAVFAFDYNNCVELVASKIYNTTPKKITRYYISYEFPCWTDDIQWNYSTLFPVQGQYPDDIGEREFGPKYVRTAFFGAGFEANEVTGTSSTANVVPVDLTKDGTIVYPIGTDALVVAGFFWSTVKDGKLTVKYQLNQGEIKKIGTPVVTVYTSRAAVRDGTPAVTCKAGHGIDIATELGGAEAVLIALNGRLVYCKDVASGVIDWTYKTPYTEYEEPVPGMVVPVTKYTTTTIHDIKVTYTLQDYFRNAPYWASYRAGLRSALNMVAE